MADVPTPLPPPCYAWLFDLLTDPLLTRYKPARRLRVALLIAYSGKRGTPGVLRHTDGHLCNAMGLGKNLDQFHRIIAEMTEFNDLRAIDVGGARRYEISRELVPTYNGDIRLSDPWDTPCPRLTVLDAPTHPLALDPAPDGKRVRGGNHKWEITDLSGAEVTAFSRYCAAQRDEAEEAGREAPIISRDKWVSLYRARKAGETVPADGGASPGRSVYDIDVSFERDEKDANVSFEPAKNQNVKTYTNGKDLHSLSRDVVGVDGDGDSVLTEKERQQQHTGETKLTDPELTLSPEPTGATTLNRQQQEVFAFFTSKGLWQEVARPAALWCDLPTAQLYAAWVRSLKPDDFGKMLRYHIEARHPIPPEIRAAYARKEQEALRQGQQQQAAQQKAVEKMAMAQEEALVAEQVQAAWDAMSETERDRIGSLAVEKLPPIHRTRYKAAREQGYPVVDMVKKQLDNLCDEILREEMRLPPRQDKNAVIPARFAQIIARLEAETDELPPDLGIPDLS